jgi:hypothetical protein
MMPTAHYELLGGYVALNIGGEIGIYLFIFFNWLLQSLSDLGLP